MRTATFLFTLAAAVGATLTTAAAQTTYVVDPQASQITWTGSKVVGGSHEGSVRLSGGTLVVSGGRLVDGAFTADMTSITVDDLTGAMADKLSGHLLSADFFGVEEHPTATFDIRRVKPLAAGKASVTGDLTIKGKTDEVTFPAEYSVGSDGTMSARGTVKVDRTIYDIRYGSAGSLGSLGDKAISDEFTLDITLSARKA